MKPRFISKPPRLTTLLAAVTTHLVLVHPATAQTLGDSIRIQFGESQGWLQGRLTSFDSTGLVLTYGLEQGRFTQNEITRIDRWVRNRAEIQIPLGAVAMGLLSAVLWAPPDTTCGSSGCRIQPGYGWTDSRQGDALIGAAAGVILGLISHAIWPGRWKRWHPWPHSP